MMRRYAIPVDGCTLNVVEDGKGAPLMFVHGAVTTSGLFAEHLGAFSPRYRGIAVDLRGFGESDKPGRGYNIEQFAADLIGVADRLGVERAVWLGVSMGGMVVQRLCLDYASRVTALVLVSTSDGELAGGLLEGDLDSVGASRDYRALSEAIIEGSFPPGADPGLPRRLKSQVATWNADVLRQVLQSIKRFGSRAELFRITIPTLILVGSEDEQTPPTFSRRLQAHIAGSQLVVFEGSGHFMMLEQPQRFRTVLGEFLEGLSPIYRS